MSILFHGFTIGIITFLVFIIGFFLNKNTFDNPIKTANTMAFMTITFCQFFHSFNLKSKTESIFSSNTFTNKPLLICVLLNCILQILTVSIPFLRESVFNLNILSPIEWLIVFSASLIPIFIIEIQKIFLRKSQK